MPHAQHTDVSANVWSVNDFVAVLWCIIPQGLRWDGKNRNVCSLMPAPSSLSANPDLASLKDLVTWNNAGKDWEGGGGEMEQEWCFPRKQKRWVHCLKPGFLRVLSPVYRTISRNDCDSCKICSEINVSVQSQEATFQWKSTPQTPLVILKFSFDLFFETFIYICSVY